MANYGKKVQSDNKHLEDLANAQFAHVDGGTATVVVSAAACNLGRVVLNTNGGAITIRTGSRIIGVIASDAPEGPFPYGVYCENGLQADVAAGVSATIVFN